MKYRIAFFFLALMLSFTAYAQEYLMDLSFNSVLEGNTLKASNKQMDTVLSLPFFDDFSNSSYAPNPVNWQDNGAFVNNSYGIGPVSIGVATFDALNGAGEHYSNASANPYVADKLTSHPIDLSGANLDSLYLTFYYQPQGYGNAPEKNDSLLLQFSADGILWETVWHATGLDFDSFRTDSLGLLPERSVDTMEFKMVHLKIDSAKYLSDNFSMRWLNYASLSGSNNPSAAINSDHWNIDYVYLNDGRTASDTIFNDVVMIDKPGIFLRNYTSLPWKHYDDAIATEISNLRLHLRNNSDQNRNVTQLSVHFEQLDLNWADSFNLGQFDLFPFENTKFPELKFSESPIPFNNNSKASFKVEARIKTDDVDVKGNNTASNVLIFDNYYAYDDGSAENAYGVDGIEARVAYRFQLFKPDSLQGVSMFFARNYPQYAAGESFSLAVWDDDNGLPGQLLALENGKYPDFSSEINGFVNIPLDSAIWLDNTFYVGWVKNSTLRLNIGWDRNKNNKERIFFNINGEWSNTEFIGSLMIRPVFGNESLTTDLVYQPKPELQLYPNPASEILYLKGLQSSANVKVQVLNTLGEVLLHRAYNSGGVGVESLPAGVYMVRILQKDTPIAVLPLMIVQ